MARHGFYVATLSALLVAVNAHAQGSTGLILSFVGRGGPDLAPLLQPVSRTLASLSPRWDAKFGAEIDREIGTPPKSLDTNTLSDYLDRFPLLDQKLSLGDISVSKGTDELESMRRTLAAKQGSLALDPTARNLYYRVLLRLALAYQENRRSFKATECMADIVRSFPDRPVEPVKNEDALVELYNRVRSSMEAQTHGSIRINGTLRPDKTQAPAKLYINGRRRVVSL